MQKKSSGRIHFKKSQSQNVLYITGISYTQKIIIIKWVIGI